MDNSYSHLAKHMSQGDVLQDMTAGKPAFPVKPLDKAVVAHMGAARLKTGSEWHQHCAFRGCEISPVVNVDEASHKHRFNAKYKRGTKEPLHIHAKASVEWVVLSGKFDVETGPVFHVPGHERTRETLVAGSFMVIPKGQPHKVHCLEPGVVAVCEEIKLRGASCLRLNHATTPSTRRLLDGASTAASSPSNDLVAPGSLVDFHTGLRVVRGQPGHHAHRGARRLGF